MAADQLNRLSDVNDDDLSEDIAHLSFEACKLSISKSAFFPGENEYEKRERDRERNLVRMGW